MKEYWVTPDEVKNIVEAHNLIDRAIDDINKFFSKKDFDEYAVAKVVFDDISDMLKPIADKVWWTEECNNYFFQLVREKMKQDKIPCKYDLYKQQRVKPYC